MAKWSKSFDLSVPTELGNFGPDRSLFGKVVEVVRLVRSHKTVNDGLHNRLAEAWLFLAGVPPCGLLTVLWLDVAPQHLPLRGFAVAHRPLGGFAMGRVRTGDLYSLVGTDKSNDSDHFAK